MTFGQKIVFERKKKNWTQTQLAEATGSTRDLIGRYERDDVKPSIEVAANMADALECSLDYLVRDIKISGKVIPEQFVPLLTEIEKLSQSDVTHVIAVIHAFIAKAKLQSIKE
jgi:transcriptional regulator with XRE-family HTH domain